MLRCGWSISDPMMVEYHDTEWGVPVYDDRKLFEFIVLESAQAGLSWRTVLRKRDAYRKAFAEFDPVKVATFDQRDIERLMQDAGIIRNRQKIEAAIGNARVFLDMQQQFHSFADYMWQFVEGRPVINAWQHLKQLPARTELSDVISHDLKQRGFKFFGTTICYAHMQATGMIVDHTVDCFRYPQLVGGHGGGHRQA